LIASRVESAITPAITGTRPRGLDRGDDQVAILVVIERVALFGGSTRRHAVRAGAYEPVELAAHQVDIDLAILAKGHCYRRNHAGGMP